MHRFSARACAETGTQRKGDAGVDAEEVWTNACVRPNETNQSILNESMKLMPTLRETGAAHNDGKVRADATWCRCCWRCCCCWHWWPLNNKRTRAPAQVVGAISMMNRNAKACVFSLVGVRMCRVQCVGYFVGVCVCVLVRECVGLAAAMLIMCSIGIQTALFLRSTDERHAGFRAFGRASVCLCLSVPAE